MDPEPLLDGLRVVEIGQYVAAPLAATLLADQGADVVKIERPGGDPYRRHPARFAAWNRGKTSEEVDLHTLEGRTRAKELIAEADVLIENLRPGALAATGVLDACHARLVTCTISAYGTRGPGRDDPGWEPLVHARAGAQQGLFTLDRPAWLPFPMASIAAGLLATLGVGAALIKREHTGYGQHVETSLLEGLLFLNAGAIFHRAGRKPPLIRRPPPPILRFYETADGRAMQVNLSGTARWRELCSLLGIDDGGLDFRDPRSLARLADDEWCSRMGDAMARQFATKTAEDWEEAMLTRPAATAHCRPLDEWVAHPQAVANGVFADALVAPPVRITSTGARKPPRQRHGSEGGALAGHRVLDISSFWAGPLAARLLAELGADVVKIEPPGGEGSYQLMAGLPNIYVDGNRSKRGMCLDLTDERDRQRFLDLVGAADVVVENAVAGTWERLNLHEAELRSHNPYLVYARAKGFGIHGPLASRPSFDYVVQAATGMIMTNGGGRPLPVNFTANDYCTGLHLAVGIVLGLLGRARGHAVTTVEASLMVTATVFQAEQVAELAASGHTDRRDLDGPSPGCHLYEAKDGWIVTCAVRPDQEKALCAALGVDSFAVAAIAAAVRPLSAADACAVLAAAGVPAAPSVHPRDVPDDPQVIGAGLLATVRHAVAGRIEQVGVPLRLSTDPPAVKGPAPVPARR